MPRREGIRSGRSNGETFASIRASVQRRRMEEGVLLVQPVAGLRQPPAHLAVLRPSAEAVAEDSFASFFEAEYGNLLRAMCLVTGNRHEAEEIVQDAFVRALERWERVRSAENRAGYLYRMALNLYRSKLRRVARGARKIVAPPPEPDRFGQADDRDEIGRALASLPSGQREAMVMVEWMGMSDEEAGALLGISPVTVRVRLHRARAVLRPLLRPQNAPEGADPAAEPGGEHATAGGSS